MKRMILFFFLLFTISFLGRAQYQGAKDGLGIRANFINYQFPITDKLNNNDFTSGAEIEYSRHFTQVLNLAFPVKLGKARLPRNELGDTRDAFFSNLDALLQFKVFRPENIFYPYLFGGVGITANDFSDFNFSVPLGIGLNFRVAQHTYLSAKGEYRFAFQDLRDNLQLGAGLLILIGEGEPGGIVTGPDRDLDGVPDDQDLCPDYAGDPALNGCPDADEDGIPDGEDDCPVMAGLPEFGGCPDSDEDGISDQNDDCPYEAGLPEYNGCPLPDSDGDGVPDEVDRCPEEFGTEDMDGCPDSDTDGIADRDDDCPQEAGKAVTNGCPDQDGDAVADRDDRCPDQPGPSANRGCPELENEDREVLEYATQAIQFETGSSRLKPESLPVLDKVVDIMERFSEYKLMISGHTDSIGSAENNQKLSEQRARSCYNYITSKGIDDARVEFVGYGETRPIADNTFREGREKNRRVEFDIYLD